jgi:hypothetical protein
MYFREALLRRVQDFSHQSEGQLWIFCFNPAGNFQVYASRCDYARRTGLIRNCKELVVFNIGNIASTCRFQACHTLDGNAAVAEDAAADMRRKFRNRFGCHAHDLLKSMARWYNGSAANGELRFC